MTSTEHAAPYSVGGLKVGDVGLAVAAPRPSLGDRAERLSDAIENLDNNLARVISRLEPVLADSTPRPGGDSDGGQKSPGPDSWLAGFLEDSTQRIHGLTGDVMRLAERIDL